MANKPEDIARESIDKRLTEAGWVIQDMKELNPSVSVGVAVREFPTSSGPVDYALFVNGKPVGVVEAKRDEAGANITSVEQQSSRYANSKFKYIKYEYRIRFAYEATGVLTRFTDYDDIDYRSRQVFSFHQPKTLAALLRDENTVRNNLKGTYPFDPAGFRSCQIDAIQNLDESFAKNKSHALVHIAVHQVEEHDSVLLHRQPRAAVEAEGKDPEPDPFDGLFQGRYSAHASSSPFRNASAKARSDG